VNLNSPFLLNLILPVPWVKHSPVYKIQFDRKLRFALANKIYFYPLPPPPESFPPKKINGVKAESFLVTVPMNLNSPFLLNLNLPVHWVKNSPLSSTQDYEIELIG
jgi:hypothetical protein